MSPKETLEKQWAVWNIKLKYKIPSSESHFSKVFLQGLVSFYSWDCKPDLKAF